MFKTHKVVPSRLLPRSIVFLFFISLITSCSLPKRNLSQQELQESFNEYLTEYETELSAISRKSVARLKDEYQKDSKKQSYDVLILSGGGEYGAFGAGFLKGWGKVKSGEFSRPEFDSVSGISTGSLIAPFAFVGTDEAYNSILEIYRNPEVDWAIPRGILPFLVGDQGYYDASKLHQRISDSLTPELIKSIADGSQQNKSLLVGATNLDYGMMRVWDLAQIAENSNYSDASEHIVNRLIASSAIPAVFSPVKLDDYLYVDGGASMQVVSGLDNREWLYRNETTGLNFIANGSKPLRIRLWIIINNKLLLEPEITPPTWSEIAKRSLASLTKASTLQTLQDLDTYSQMINSRPEFDVQMFYVAIPQSYEVPDTDNMFDTKIMRNLADLGEKMGANPNIWQERAIRPGAPMPTNLK